MLEQNRPQFIHLCDDCNVEYVGGHCAPCPLCPQREKLQAARLEVHRYEPYLLLSHNDTGGIEALLNDACSDDWDLRDLKVAHEEDRDNGGPLFVAVLRREQYDHARHQAAVESRRQALIAHREQRAAIEGETRAFRDGRDGRPAS